MEKMVFGVIVLVWAVCGFMGIMRCEKLKANWWLIGFSAAVPFIPLVAKCLGVL